MTAVLQYGPVIPSDRLKTLLTPARFDDLQATFNYGTVHSQPPRKQPAIFCAVPEVSAARVL